MAMKTKVQRIIIDGEFVIYKTIAPILGGNYSVVNLKNKTAKSGLCLDAAYEIFKKLTLEAKLRSSDLIK